MSSTIVIDLITPSPSARKKLPLSKGRPTAFELSRVYHHNRKPTKPIPAPPPPQPQPPQDDWISDDEVSNYETETRFVPPITPAKLQTPARKVSRLQKAKDLEIQALKEQIKLKDVEIARLKAISGETSKILRRAYQQLLKDKREEKLRQMALEKLENFWVTL